MRRWRLSAAAVLVGLASSVSPGASASEAGTPVLVTGDSLPAQAVDQIRTELARAGYEDVRFAVYGGTMIDWAAEQVRDADEPIVVFATGSNNAQGGWSDADARDASDAVTALGRVTCAIWVLPKAAWYPGGHEVPAPDAAATVEGIRQSIAGSAVQIADWAEVADAVPEIHDRDGVHHTAGGQALYAELVAGAVAGGCAPVDPAATAAHERYVDAAHRILLGRDATDAARARWTWGLDHGHPRLAFARRLGTTPEWVDRQIGELYRIALGREPDADGLAHWRQQVVSGAPLAAVAANVHGSHEARVRAGGTDAALVDALYRGLLQREPESRGAQFWTEHLAAGAPASDVAAELHGSLESRRERVRRLYGSILGREPDTSGLAHWAEALASVGDLRLAATLASSEELFRRTSVEP